MTQEIIEKPMSAECTMKQYEAIPDSDFVENREYQLTDYPDNGANAEQMAYALTCKRLFPAGTVVTFSGITDTNYTNGHLYQIEVDTSGTKSWKDITPVSEQSIPIITGTQEKPINLATDLENGKWYLLTGYIRTNSSSVINTNMQIMTFRGVAGALNYVYFYGAALLENGTGSFMVYHKISDNGYILETHIYRMVSNFNGRNSSNLLEFYAPETSGTSGQILQSKGANNAPTWIDMPKGQIQTLVYDNTTLADHIADILSHINAENGGTLLSIGFKTSTASVLANGTKNTVASDGTNTVTTVSAAVLKPSTFYSFRAADINKTDDITSLTLNGPNGLDGCSSTNIDINYDASTVPTPTMLCQASGCSTNLVDGNIETTVFKGVNLLNIPLEHLVIDYYTV